jgi:hypothetical protein
MSCKRLQATIFVEAFSNCYSVVDALNVLEFAVEVHLVDPVVMDLCSVGLAAD